MKEISRRNFIKGAAASALSVAALGKLGGFSPEAAADGRQGTLTIRNVWYEPGVRQTKKIAAAVKRYAR